MRPNKTLERIKKELEDVPGKTALDKVRKLKEWYLEIYREAEYVRRIAE